jgi:hypothetical protein
VRTRKEDVRASGTHLLESTEGRSGQDMERKRARATHHLGSAGGTSEDTEGKREAGGLVRSTHQLGSEERQVRTRKKSKLGVLTFWRA